MSFAISSRLLALAVTLAASCAEAARSEDSPVTGSVLDESGRPAANVEVSFYWTANEWFDEKGERRPPLEVWKHVGGMRSSTAVKTDVEGRFALKADDADRHRVVMAMDGERRRGGIARADEEGRLTIRLEPLTRVHGVVLRADTKEMPQWSAAYVITPEDHRFPLTRDRLAHCGSYDGRFEFLLPPGVYRLEGYGSEEDESLDLWVPRPREVTVTADGGEMDLGELVVHLRDQEAEVAKADAPAGDFRELYGRPVPKWYATDTRGVAAGVQPSDYAGRWVVHYFWGTGCLPCLREGLPSLAEFTDRHRDSADRFAVITVFEGTEAEGFASLEDLDRWLGPIKRRVWKREVTLPVLLDTTYRTRKSLGLRNYGTALLIDPAGNLVKVEPEETLQPVLDRLAAELAR